MITTELNNIQGLISSNAKLSTGMEFLRLMRTEGLLEASKGLFPAIMGGAVRDGLFLNREIHDIDIFLFRDTRSPLATEVRNSIVSVNGVTGQMEEVRQNILAWLEDMEMEHQSLLSDRASAYFGSNQFLDIIQFVWNDVTIQVMIPTGNMLSQSMDTLLRTMPIYSGVALTMDYLRMFDATLASYFLPDNHYFLATDRDLPYLRNKAPNGVLIPVSHAREAVAYSLQRFMETRPLTSISGNLSTSDILHINASNTIVRRAFAHRTGVTDNLINQGNTTPVPNH